MAVEDESERRGREKTSEWEKEQRVLREEETERAIPVLPSNGSRVVR